MLPPEKCHKYTPKKKDAKVNLTQHIFVQQQITALTKLILKSQLSKPLLFLGKR